MSLSRSLQSPDILALAHRFDPPALRSAMLERGRSWFAHNRAQQERIAHNLAAFGFDPDQALLDRTQDHIILHYYEKLLPLGGSPAEFARFIDTTIDAAEAIAMIQNAITPTSGALLATGHFGGVEFIVPALSRGALALTAALRFTTQEFSQKAHDRAGALSQSGLFAPIRFIEIGKPGVSAALDMAAAVRRGEALTSVFDERTEYSKPASLLGRKVWGGAGLDRFIAFTRQSVTVFAVFMVRTEAGTYRLDCTRIDPDNADPIDAMYRRLEELIRRTPWQWYFLHEEAPFVST
jgi:lauroyl/myristoyl acyltransferase